MARSKKTHYPMKSRKSGKKSMNQIKKNNLVLSKVAEELNKNLKLG